MADISKVKVNGNLYDIKDINARNANFWKYETEWDGDISEFEPMYFLGTNYYRIQDAIKLEQDSILMANASGVIEMIGAIGSDGIFEIVLIPTMLEIYSGCSLSPGNIVSSSISMKGAVKDLITAELFEEIGDNAELVEGVEQDLLNLEAANVHCGACLLGSSILGGSPFMFWNIPQDTQIGPYLCSFFGIPEDKSVMPEGLWVSFTSIPTASTDENGETIEKEILIFPNIFFSSTSPTTIKMVDLYINSLTLLSTVMSLREEPMTLEESIKTGNGKLIFKALKNTLKSQRESI